MKHCWIRTFTLAVVLGAPALAVSLPDEDPGELELSARRLVEQLRSQPRTIDPFGYGMNPKDKSSLIVEAPAPAQEEEVQVRSSLREALSKLVIIGVNPARNTVLVGARRLRAGEEFVIVDNAISLRLRLDDVSLKELKITDLDTGEVALHPLGIAPSLRAERPKLPAEQFQPFGGVLTLR